MSENEKIYVGRAKYRETKFGELLRIWITPEGLEAMNHHADNNGGINLEMHELRNPDRGGFTHYIIVDDFKPENGRKGASDGARRHGHSDRREERDREERRHSGERTPDRRRDDDGGFDAYAGQPQPPVDPSYGPEVPPENESLSLDDIPF